MIEGNSFHLDKCLVSLAWLDRLIDDFKAVFGALELATWLFVKNDRNHWFSAVKKRAMNGQQPWN